MDKYVIIKDLPDAKVGTEVVWDENQNAYYYNKNSDTLHQTRNYLSASQINESYDFFCKFDTYPENYAYSHPVYNRCEIINLIKECFPNKRMTGRFEISASKEINEFAYKLRELGKKNAIKLLYESRSE